MAYKAARLMKFRRIKNSPMVTPVDDYSDPSVSFWPTVTVEEWRDTGLLDKHGEPILWYPEKIGF